MPDNPPAPVLVQPKPWWRSKTDIYNIIKTVLGLITAIVTVLMTLQANGQLPFEVDPRWLGLILALDGAAGIWLRGVTDSPVTMGGGQ